MDRAEIITANPLIAEIERTQVRKRTAGGEHWYLCPFHADKNPSLRVSEKKQLWRCDPCDIGGSVIDWVSRIRTVGIAEAMSALTPEDYSPRPRLRTAASSSLGSAVATYDYVDARGEIKYQVQRFQDADGKKTFRPRQPVGSGQWKPGLSGLTKVLYNLPNITANEKVWVVEGEKDADTLNDLGFAATCCSGGCSGWAVAYAEYLRGKSIILCGDNDEAGEKYVKAVADSVEGKVKRLTIVKLPREHNDVTDYHDSLADSDRFRDALERLVRQSPTYERGIDHPAQRISELEPAYVKSLAAAKTNSVDLSKWLPSLREVRPMVAGEFGVIMGDTGTGKTMILSHIAATAGVATLFFQLELPESVMFERFAALSNNLPVCDVEQRYTGGHRPLSTASLDNVYVVTPARLRGGLTPAILSDHIERAELKLGCRPALVIVDYLQLMRSGHGGKRYEQASDIAEELKVLAGTSETVIIAGSQIRRPSYDNSSGKQPRIALHDAKDSGAIENSAQVVIGVWRKDGMESDDLDVKILKQTRGRAGGVIRCECDWARLRIREKITPYEEEF